MRILTDVESRVRPGALAVVAGAGTAVVLGIGLWFVLRDRSVDVLYDLWVLQNGPSAIVMYWMAYLVLRRSPTHAAGWILLAVAAVETAHVVAAAFTDAALVAMGITQRATEMDVFVPSAFPLAASVPIWFMTWLWVPAAVPLLVVLPLVFPDGRLPGRRWLAVLVVAAVATVLLVAATAIRTWPTAEWNEDDPPAVVDVLFVAGGAGVLAAVLAGLAAFVIRWRRSHGSRRGFEVLGGAVVVGAGLLVATYPWPQLWTPLSHVVLNALIVVYALAILRYRLHDIEPVLGKGAVVVALSLLVIGVYLTVVVGLGRLVGTRTDDPVLPLVAVALVALLVEPTRRGLTRIVERRLYGRRADRGTVLGTLADRATRADDTPTALEDVADLLRRGTGAGGVEVLAGERAVAGVVPAGRDPVARHPVAHRGELFGEVRLFAHAAADLAPEAAQLLTDVASVLGIVLHNERLTERLAAQLDELRASQRRLVEAHHEARRGLERDIHDGAQARLVALRLRVAALSAQADQAADPAMAEGLGSVGDGLDEAIRTLRSLARGLHPPILEQSGVATAVRAHLRDLPVRVEVTEHGAQRYPRPVEGAAYFSCFEAVQNAVRHSGATTIGVVVESLPDELRLRVTDDGHGFDRAERGDGTGLTNLSDRIGALGGRVEIGSGPGGTTVAVSIPATALGRPAAGPGQPAAAR